MGHGCSEYFGLGFRISELPSSEMDSSSPEEVIINEGIVCQNNDDEEVEPYISEDSEEIISQEQIEKTIPRVDAIVALTKHILQLGENIRFNINHVTLENFRNHPPPS